MSWSGVTSGFLKLNVQTLRLWSLCLMRLLISHLICVQWSPHDLSHCLSVVLWASPCPAGVEIQLQWFETNSTISVCRWRRDMNLTSPMWRSALSRCPSLRTASRRHTCATWETSHACSSPNTPTTIWWERPWHLQTRERAFCHYLQQGLGVFNSPSLVFQVINLSERKQELTKMNPKVVWRNRFTTYSNWIHTHS